MEGAGLRGAQSDRLTSHLALPALRLWIMAIMAECLLSSSSFCLSRTSSWTFCNSRDEAWPGQQGAVVERTHRGNEMLRGKMQL